MKGFFLVLLLLLVGVCSSTMDEHFYDEFCFRQYLGCIDVQSQDFADKTGRHARMDAAEEAVIACSKTENDCRTLYNLTSFSSLPTFSPYANGSDSLTDSAQDTLMALFLFGALILIVCCW